jgi:hypothetical protein
MPRATTANQLKNRSLGDFPPESSSIRWEELGLREYRKWANSGGFIQVISDASKSTVDGIRRICRSDMKPPSRLRGSLTKFVFIRNDFFGTKDQF